MQPEPLTADVQRCEHTLPRNKRRSTSHDDSEPPHKIGRRPEQQAPAGLSNNRKHQRNPLPSPPPTKTFRDRTGSPQIDSLPRKRKARSLDYVPSNPRSTKRPRVQSTPVESSPFIEEWLSHLPEAHLPEDEKFDHDGEDPSDMSLPPPKRSRSSDDLGRTLSQSGEGTESTISREKKYAAYRDGNYSVVLETKGSFMRPSDAGLVDEDKTLYKDLLHTSQLRPVNPLFDEEFDRFHALLRGRSEARIYLDLHPWMVPSVENLRIVGREEFDGLIEGHNDIWAKSIPFYGPRPQPDHTYGFKWSNFSETQRQKLRIDPGEKSYYTAREDIYFPFLTSEVKCGKQGLDLADRPNTHSMTVALRGIVDLYRKANCASDVHRRALGFSISHDEHNARIYVHYPEIDGENTTYWRETIKELNLGDGKGRANWTCGQFTLNACQIFAPALLARLRGVIDRLADPIRPTLELANLDDLSVQSSQDDASAPESQDEGFRKPRRATGLHVELRTMIQNLQRQLERQREESEQERKESEQQRKEMMTQMEQQRKGSEQQQKELMQLLKQQSEQIRELSQKR